LLAVIAAGVGTGAAEPAPALPATLTAFPLTEVRLLDGPFRHAQEMDLQYLLALDPDRFLHTFRVNAGLPSRADPYGGWESPISELRGHALGHYLSACSLMYASTGDPRLKSRIHAIVAALAECQEALARNGSNPGYLSAFPESFFDRVDRRQPVWAPWYTMHKIMAGLLEAYQDADEPEALEILRRQADWVRFRVGRLSTMRFQISLQTEHGGMNEVLANLSAVTGNPDDLRLAQAFNHQYVFAPLERGEDRLDHLHGNTQIPKIIGAAREYELTGNPAYRQVARFFWERVANERSFVFGGDTDGEFFFPVGDEPEHLHETTAETCNTYNMLKLTRHLFAWEPSAETMDFYERALYNHILASQNPRTGMMIYFMSSEPGFRKLYNTSEHSFWCCTGTGMENHAKYGDTLFFHDDRSLYVNLFIPAELNWPERRLRLRQETRFPEDSGTEIILHPQAPLHLAVKIRWPSWSDTIAVTVNGHPVALDGTPGSYVTLDATWNDGDRIGVRFAMRLRTEALRGDPEQVAVLYGPIVLAGSLGREGLNGKPNEVSGAWPNAHITGRNPIVPGFLTDAASLPARIRPVLGGEPLEFETVGVGRPSDVRLIPLYRVVDERYTIYWHLYDEASWSRHLAQVGPAEEARRYAQEHHLDEVWAGDREAEESHGVLEGESRVYDANSLIFRESPHGPFGWTLQSAPGHDLFLTVGYVARPGLPFEIDVNGRRLATEQILPSADGRPMGLWVVRTYAVSSAQAGGSDKVEVRFTGVDGGRTGQVIFCELARRD
jgi:DUF1680 family protein